MPAPVFSRSSFTKVVLPALPVTLPPPSSRPPEDVAKALQRRSRLAQGLNVQKGVRLDLSLAVALLDGLFQHPLGSTPRPLVTVRVTRGHRAPGVLQQSQPICCPRHIPAPASSP